MGVGPTNLSGGDRPSGEAPLCSSPTQRGATSAGKGSCRKLSRRPRQTGRGRLVGSEAAWLTTAAREKNVRIRKKKKKVKKTDQQKKQE